MSTIFQNWPEGKSIMSKHWFGTKFDTLEQTAAEILVILYEHPLISLRFYLSFLKFLLIFMNMDIRLFAHLATKLNCYVQGLVWYHV